MKATALHVASLTRRHALKLAAILGATAALAGSPALAQDAYPSQPIHIVVSFGAGGATDSTARISPGRSPSATASRSSSTTSRGRTAASAPARRPGRRRTATP
ncbi:MAG: twin-arginine translocation signal domain-containing protein [Geminicoccaceae bacterium]